MLSQQLSIVVAETIINCINLLWNTSKTLKIF